MAFFTRVHLNVPILPGEEIRSESSTLTRGESLVNPEVEEEVESECDDGEEEEDEDDETTAETSVEPCIELQESELLNVIVKDNKTGTKERHIKGAESDVVMETNSEIARNVDEDSRTVEGSEALESNNENQRFDYVVDRILGVEV